ncbi:BamA/OMP85 family outer membrane protein [Lignipirellula cremea]|uniref:Translocation and assembly module TamA n=1 Tax=Lignipirellula cremea TaxID=2528010 RepID=A0A518DT22_9BACT|nr:BamA/TamA family outer membrane protein [Lignipirellula cremea]QDU94989.1 Translocation and assembly module TamA precursor [Lignipirellula cremea]
MPFALDNITVNIRGRKLCYALLIVALATITGCAPMPHFGQSLAFAPLPSGPPGTVRAPSATPNVVGKPVVRAQNGAYGPSTFGSQPGQPGTAPPTYTQPGYPSAGAQNVYPQQGAAPPNYAPQAYPPQGYPAGGAPNPYPQNTAPAPGQQPYTGAEMLPPGAVQQAPGMVGPGPMGLDPGLAPIQNPMELPDNFADIEAFVEEARTGRFMFGVGVNSDAGVTGQITVDERNFDITKIPTSWADWVNGTAFRGAGQGFRIEALPGSQVQRYMMTFTEPYLFDSKISLNVSAFFFDRAYNDWQEQRLGGRVAFGYRLTHDLSLSAGLRAESVDVHSPRVNNVPELNAALGTNQLYSGSLTLSHDTRDSSFAPTEGHLLSMTVEQAFGSFSYPRAEVDYRRYHMLRQRPDGSGRHTLSYSLRAGFTGSDTPIYENYYAGGFSTLRGFDFRGASPKVNTVTVGGEFRFLGSVEYLFPLTADDMLQGVVFVDYGTVEEKIEINQEDFRVAPGFGLRIKVPALGPAPLALDLAFPVAMEDTDDKRLFSFFIGLNR